MLKTILVLFTLLFATPSFAESYVKAVETKEYLELVSFPSSGPAEKRVVLGVIILAQAKLHGNKPISVIFVKYEVNCLKQIYQPQKIALLNSTAEIVYESNIEGTWLLGEKDFGVVQATCNSEYILNNAQSDNLDVVRYNYLNQPASFTG